MSDNPDDEFDPLSAGDDADRVLPPEGPPWPIILVTAAVIIGVFVTWLLL